MASDMTAEIENGEMRLRAAIIAGDVASLDDLLRDDAIFTDQFGHLLTKADDLAVHRSGDLRIEAFEPTDRSIREAGNVAIVSVLVQLSGSYRESAFQGMYRYTRVWAKGRRGWQVVAAHCSAVG